MEELEENEEDLVSEIENIAKERHNLELQYHAKCQENEDMKITLAEECRLQENLDSEKNVLVKKLESQQQKNREWTW